MGVATTLKTKKQRRIQSPAREEGDREREGIHTGVWDRGARSNRSLPAYASLGNVYSMSLVGGMYS